ncbi:MAG: hypothetical protein A2516_09720 [Alphaproteobacteria bacterium RIFOXYD12_FULL_60_8]|nr:MAG: hypothetical protein A2516_09720 [Alphaproteobacteria bacterium RIFOXYD12_FULL_60_8]
MDKLQAYFLSAIIFIRIRNCALGHNEWFFCTLCKATQNFYVVIRGSLNFKIAIHVGQIKIRQIGRAIDIKTFRLIFPSDFCRIKKYCPPRFPPAAEVIATIFGLNRPYLHLIALNFWG